MAVFIEKPDVTSSNYYETMKNASILMKLVTNVDWTITSVVASKHVYIREKVKLLSLQ
jgi:hypothetical protein